MTKYRRELDGVRALAVISVMLFHAGFRTFSGGFVGVDVFFVISGYLITDLIVGEHDKGKFSLQSFYERRARRILPALFVVVACCLPVAIVLILPGDLRNFGKSILAVTAFSSNFLFWRERGYFEANAAEKPLLHTWTLAVEEQYYLLFPLFLLLVWRLRRGRSLLPATIALGLASLALSEWGWRYHQQANFYLAPFRAWELLTGAACALLMRPSNRIWHNQLLAALGLLAILYAVVFFDSSTPMPSVYGILPVGGCALIILFGRSDTRVAQLLATPPLVAIGLVSYSAYLWHQPLLAFAKIIGREDRLTTELLLLASLALAWVTWKFVEVPFRNRDAVPLKRFVPFIGGLAVLVNSVAVASVVTGGFLDRYNVPDRPLAEINVPDAGRYVAERFAQYELVPFSPDGRKKVLVIGDSFSEDLVNALAEADALRNVQISMYAIAVDCGNLDLQHDFTELIAEGRRRECRAAGWYDKPALATLMRQADVIVLASAWLEWQIRLLPSSISNMERATSARILVLERKDFGRYTIRQLLDIPPPQRWSVERPISAQVQIVTALTRKLIPESMLVDSVRLLCGETATCRLFTQAHELVSFDGTHLTKAGAKYFGMRLLTDSLVRDALFGRRP